MCHVLLNGLLPDVPGAARGTGGTGWTQEGWTDPRTEPRDGQRQGWTEPEMDRSQDGQSQGWTELRMDRSQGWTEPRMDRAQDGAWDGQKQGILVNSLSFIICHNQDGLCRSQFQSAQSLQCKISEAPNHISAPPRELHVVSNLHKRHLKIILELRDKSVCS